MNQYHNPEDCGPDEYSWRNEYAREHQCKDPECSPETVHFHGSAYTSLATEETILDGLANYRAKRKIAWVKFGAVVIIAGCIIYLLLK